MTLILVEVTYTIEKNRKQLRQQKNILLLKLFSRKRRMYYEVQLPGARRLILSFALIRHYITSPISNPQLSFHHLRKLTTAEHRAEGGRAREGVCVCVGEGERWMALSYCK